MSCSLKAISPAMRVLFWYNFRLKLRDIETMTCTEP